jgi:hypothetical protein
VNLHIASIIDDLKRQLSQAEAAARIKAETIAEQQKEIGKLTSECARWNEVHTENWDFISKHMETIAEQQREIERLTLELESMKRAKGKWTDLEIS